MIVIDASVALNACLSDVAFAPLESEELAAPNLLWSEVLSVLHEMRWRREISSELASHACERLREAPIARRRPARLSTEAWRVADEFGWAKTHDAEYVALANLLGCRLVTIDARLRRTASRLVDVVGPTEL